MKLFESLWLAGFSLIFLLITPVFAETLLLNASYEIKHLFDEDETSFNSCSYPGVECVSQDGKGNVTVVPVVVDEYRNLREDKAYMCEGISYALKHDISVLSVFACIKSKKEWGNVDGDTLCYIYAGENSSGKWKAESYEFDCNELPQENFAKICFNSTDFFNLTKLNHSGIGWGIDYSRGPSDSRRSTTHDWFYLNVSYIPLQFLYWQSNATLLHRGESAEIASKWQIKDIALAKTKHNFSGSFAEYKLESSKECKNLYWVNFTVTFTSSQASDNLQSSSNSFVVTQPGYYEVSYIYAQDSYGGYNKSFPKIGLAFYGFAKVSEIYVNDSYVYPTESVLASCKVVDANTSEPIESYNVSFYRNESFIGSSLTNSSGIASLAIPIPDREGIFEIKCNISDAPELYYNASEESEKTAQIISKNLSVEIKLSKTSLNYGETVEIKINITNSSQIENILLNETFFNITSSCTLEKVKRVISLNISKCYEQNLCEANVTIPVFRAAIHNISAAVFARSPFGAGENYSHFFVNFGVAKPYFRIPYYFVLHKQNFSIIAGISAVSGDVWNVSLNLTIDGQESINITESETFEKKFIIQAIKPGLECKVTWNAFSNATGLVRMKIEALPANGSSASYSESFEVIEPSISFPPNVSFSASEIFIDEFTLIKANIIGNATPCKVNFTVLKPYNSGNESFGFDFIEIKNVTECGVELESGNIASLEKQAYANASYNQEDAYLAIDEDNVTYWSWGEASVFNVTFRKPDYAIARIEILWKKIVLEEVNATIKYLSPTGQIGVFRKNIPVPESKNITLFADFRPFKAGKLIINLTGGTNIYEIRVYPATPRVDKCYVFVKNFTSQNLTRSGFYNLSASVLTSAGSLINLENSSFFVKFGTPVLEISEETPSSMLIGKVEKYILRVKAFRGDLRNLTLNWSSVNTTYLDVNETEESNKTIAFLSNGNIEEVFWYVNAKSLPSGYSNFTVLTYVNATSEFANANSSTEFNVTLYPEDNIPPTIHSFWFEIFGVKTNKTNLNFTLSIIANVTDNIWVRGVNATIVYPQNYNATAKMKREGNLWNFTFSLDGLYLNETGNYSIRIEAIDINYTKTLSNFSELNVTNKLILVVESPKILNRGEFLNISVRDINNITLPFKVKFYFQANLSNGNYSISINNESLFFIYFLDSSQQTGKYKSFINASIYNNTANISFEFEVSNKLIINVIAPLENTAFEPGSAISGVDLPRIKVYNVRGDKEITNVNASVKCLNSSYSLQEHSISFGACGVFPNTISFAECMSKCYAPNSYGSVFRIEFFAKDSYNNSGNYSLSLKTISQTIVQESQIISSGGGGGISGFSPPVCNCTEWKDIGCGIGPCKEDEMYQERICTPANCSIEWRCIKHVKCRKKIISFEIDYTNTTVSVVKGINYSVFVFVSNSGEEKINLTSEAKAEICKLFYPQELSLGVGDVKVLKISIYCPLNITAQNDRISFRISGGNITKEGAVAIRIKNNPKIIEAFSLKKKWESVRKTVEELEKIGVKDEEIEKTKSEIETVLREIEESMRQDSSERLLKSVNKLEELVDKIEERLNSQDILIKKILAIAKANIHWIILSIFIFIYVSYLIFEVLKPYLKITKMISSLKAQEKDLIKARIETQKQFFMRKIDEKTFREMIVKRQHEILTIRAKIKNLTDEKQVLMKRVWNPLYTVKWLKSVLSKIPKVIYKVIERIKEYGALVYWRIRFR